MSTKTPPRLIDVLRGIDAHRYVVMKSLPDAQPPAGSDIDLLCEDAEALGRQLVRNCRPLIGEGYELRIRQVNEGQHAHIDLMDGDNIQLRLDLYEGLDGYPGLAVRETFTHRLIKRRQWQELATDAGTLRLAVPEPADNLVLRYLEYHAYFDARPDKIKHAQAIAAQTQADPALRNAFLDRLGEAMTQRPAGPILEHCDINLKRQATWLAWSLRDKAAWRFVRLKQIAVMALTEPATFARKLANKLRPQRTSATA